MSSVRRGLKKRAEGTGGSRRARRRIASARVRRSAGMPEMARADEVWTAITAYLDGIFLPGEG